jgi:hypothetical protein
MHANMKHNIDRKWEPRLRATLAFKSMKSLSDFKQSAWEEMHQGAISLVPWFHTAAHTCQSDS